MANQERTLFTVGVFKDVTWAQKGIQALREQGFQQAVVTVLAKENPDTTSFVQTVTGATPETFELPKIGTVVGRGSLVGVLQGAGKDLGRVGISGAIGRAGFQPHDGLIYETLTGKGGVLVAIEDAARVSDALAVLLSYGAGNAAVGAWAGRV